MASSIGRILTDGFTRDTTPSRTNTGNPTTRQTGLPGLRWYPSFSQFVAASDARRSGPLRHETLRCAGPRQESDVRDLDLPNRLKQLHPLACLRALANNADVLFNASQNLNRFGRRL